MNPKRPFRHDRDGGDEDDQGSKRFKSSVRDVLGNFSIEDFVSKMEPFLRNIVRETVEESVSRFFHQSSRPSSSYQPESSARREFLLQFADTFPSTIFTNSKIETEEGNPIRIILLDANTMSVVTSGPLSSMKIEIVALDGDFGSDNQEDWSASEFEAKIIRQREGKRPLVTGELTVTLKEGVAIIGDVAFTDNSSWIKCRRFRVGAIPVLGGDLGVREAISGRFMVKDHRGESYKKHHPPSQNDEIWRLERIAKGGAYHKRLATNGVQNVGDFVQMLAVDPSRLRRMFDGISNRTWDAIKCHAATCVADEDELYAYYVPGQTIALLFNPIYKLVGATFDGHSYERVERLNTGQMALVENLKRQAYRNTGDFVAINARSVFGPARPLSIMQADHFDDPNIGLNQLSLPVPRHDVQPEMVLEISDPSTSSPYHPDSGTSGSQFEFMFGQHPNTSISGFPPNLRNSFKIGDLVPLFTEESHWPQSASEWPLDTCSPSLTPDECSPSLTPDELSPVVHTSAWTNVVNPTTWGQAGSNTFFLASSVSEPELGIISSHPISGGAHVSRIGNPREKWFKLKVALKLRKFMRDVAARRAQLLYVDYDSF